MQQLVIPTVPTGTAAPAGAVCLRDVETCTTPTWTSSSPTAWPSPPTPSAPR
ncbi:hypothetical protein [Blastococcus sp. SYSU DS0533]